MSEAEKISVKIASQDLWKKGDTFVADKFKSGKSVIYFQNGEWKIGELTVDASNSDYNENKKLLKLKVSGNDLELRHKPRVFEKIVTANLPTGVLDINGTKYSIVDSLVPTLDGGVEYVLKDTSAPAKEIKIRQEILHSLMDKAEKKDNLDQLKTEINNVKNLRQKELLQEFTSLKTKFRELDKLFGPEKDISDFDREEAEKLEEETKKLKVELDRLVNDLTTEVNGITAKEAEAALTKEQKDLATGWLAKVSKDFIELGKKDVLENAEKKQKWQEITKYRKDKLAEIKSGVGTAPQKKAMVDALNIDSTYKDPGLAPVDKRLDDTNDDEEREENLWYTKFTALETKALTAGTSEEKLLTGIKEKLKKVAADKSVADVAGDYPRGNAAGTASEKKQFADFRTDLMKVCKEVLDEWQNKKEIDWDKETGEIDAKLTDLENDLSSGKLTAEITEVKKLIAELKAIPKDKNKEKEEKVLTVWQKLHEIEVKKFELANKPKEREMKETVVDIPLDLMKEILECNVEKAKGLMEGAYEVATGKAGGIDNLGLKNRAIDFITSISLTDSQQTELRKIGINNWEKFFASKKDELGIKLTEQFSLLAKTEVDAWMARTVSQIEGKSKWQWVKGLFTKKTVKGIWNWIKNPDSLRLAIHTALIGGTSFGLNFLSNVVAPIAPNSIKRGVVGGLVGGLKVGLGRLMGKEDGWFEDQRKARKTEKEEKKKELVTSTIAGDMFKVKFGLNTIEDSGKRKMASAFSTIIREQTGTEEMRKKKIITADSTDIYLSEQMTTLYREILRRAAEDEGIEIEPQAKLELERALVKLQSAVVAGGGTAEEQRPLMMRGIEPLLAAISGRNAKGEKVSLGKQICITGLVGTSIGVILSEASIYGRGGLAAIGGYALGTNIGYAREKGAVSIEGEKMADGMLNVFYSEVEKGDSADPQKVQEYFHIFQFALQGKLYSEKLLKIASKEIKQYKKLGADFVRAVLTNKMIEVEMKVAVVEANRSGLLSREGGVSSFERALANLQTSGNKLDESMKKKVKNSLWTRITRWSTRQAWGIGGAGVMIGATLGGAELIKATGVLDWGKPTPPTEEQLRAIVDAETRGVSRATHVENMIGRVFGSQSGVSILPAEAPEGEVPLNTGITSDYGLSTSPEDAIRQAGGGVDNAVPVGDINQQTSGFWGRISGWFRGTSHGTGTVEPVTSQTVELPEPRLETVSTVVNVDIPERAQNWNFFSADDMRNDGHFFRLVGSGHNASEWSADNSRLGLNDNNLDIVGSRGGAVEQYSQQIIAEYPGGEEALARNLIQHHPEWAPRGIDPNLVNVNTELTDRQIDRVLHHWKNFMNEELGNTGDGSTHARSGVLLIGREVNGIPQLGYAVEAGQDPLDRVNFGGQVQEQTIPNPFGHVRPVEPLSEVVSPAQPEPGQIHIVGEHSEYENQVSVLSGNRLGNLDAGRTPAVLPDQGPLHIVGEQPEIENKIGDFTQNSLGNLDADQVIEPTPVVGAGEVTTPNTPSSITVERRAPVYSSDNVPGDRVSLPVQVMRQEMVNPSSEPSVSSAPILEQPTPSAVSALELQDIQRIGTEVGNFVSNLRDNLSNIITGGGAEEVRGNISHLLDRVRDGVNTGADWLKDIINPDTGVVDVEKVLSDTLPPEIVNNPAVMGAYSLMVQSGPGNNGEFIVSPRGAESHAIRFTEGDQDNYLYDRDLTFGRGTSGEPIAIDGKGQAHIIRLMLDDNDKPTFENIGTYNL